MGGKGENAGSTAHAGAKDYETRRKGDAHSRTGDNGTHTEGRTGLGATWDDRRKHRHDQGNLKTYRQTRGYARNVAGTQRCRTQLKTTGAGLLVPCKNEAQGDIQCRPTSQRGLLGEQAQKGGLFTRNTKKTSAEAQKD